MASIPFSSLFLAISVTLLVSLFSRVHSLTCNSQKLPKNRDFSNCTDLPTLGATLHYTYDASNSSLAVAYIAEPAKPDGWVAWGINPTRLGMVGTQALIAFKLNGKVTVQTYNLTSYKGITQTKLSFEVWDLAAEENDGKITIFATVKVPGKVESLNQVWQVGPSVTGGMPDKHEFAPQNLKATGPLQLVGTAAANNGSGSGNATAGGSGGGKSGGVSLMGERFGLGFYLALFLILLGCFSL